MGELMRIAAILLCVLSMSCTTIRPHVLLADVYPESWGGSQGDGPLTLAFTETNPYRVSDQHMNRLTPCVIANESLSNVVLNISLPTSWKIQPTKIWQQFPQNGRTTYAVIFAFVGQHTCLVPPEPLQFIVSTNGPRVGLWTIDYVITATGRRADINQVGKIFIEAY